MKAASVNAQGIRNLGPSLLHHLLLLRHLLILRHLLMLLLLRGMRGIAAHG